jgi:hypothetical protein
MMPNEWMKAYVCTYELDVNKYTDALFVASKEIDLEVNAEKAK